jgi:hypothetical protein
MVQRNGRWFLELSFNGQANERLTFGQQVLLYNAGPGFAKNLLKILPFLSDRFVDKITPKEVRNLGPVL